MLATQDVYAIDDVDPADDDLRGRLIRKRHIIDLMELSFSQEAAAFAATDGYEEDGSPSNPTGTLIAKRELQGIAAFIAERGGVLIVDEIYQGLSYGVEPWTALGLPGEVVVINSFSKYFCMTGWRLGWAVLPASAVRGLSARKRSR